VQWNEKLTIDIYSAENNADCFYFLFLRFLIYCWPAAENATCFYFLEVLDVLVDFL